MCKVQFISKHNSYFINIICNSYNINYNNNWVISELLTVNKDDKRSVSHFSLTIIQLTQIINQFRVVTSTHNDVNNWNFRSYITRARSLSHTHAQTSPHVHAETLTSTNSDDPWTGEEERQLRGCHPGHDRGGVGLSTAGLPSVSLPSLGLSTVSLSSDISFLLVSLYNFSTWSRGFPEISPVR